MLVFPFPNSNGEKEKTLEDRVRRLENAMVHSLEALQSVVERIETRFGADVFGADLKHLTSAGADDQLREQLSVIDQLVNAGKHSVAAKEFRDASACTWDQAHNAVRHWRVYPSEVKLRWLKLTRFIKHIESTALPE